MPDIGATREVQLGGRYPRVYTVQYVELTSRGKYYDVHTPGREPARVKVSDASKPVACLTCQSADRCPHAWAVKRIHKQLWGEGCT